MNTFCQRLYAVKNQPESWTVQRNPEIPDKIVSKMRKTFEYIWTNSYLPFNSPALHLALHCVKMNFLGFNFQLGMRNTRSCFNGDTYELKISYGALTSKITDPNKTKLAAVRRPQTVIFFTTSRNISLSTKSVVRYRKSRFKPNIVGKGILKSNRHKTGIWRRYEERVMMKMRKRSESIEYRRAYRKQNSDKNNPVSHDV
jgi:hypothetical protein